MKANTKTNSSNTPRRTSFRRPGLIVAILFLIIIIALIVAKLLANSTASSTENSTTFSTKPVENSNNSSESSREEIPTKKEEKVQYEGENPNNSSSLTGFITASRISGNNYIIRVSIDQYLSSGTCTLTMTGNGNVHTDTVPITADASTSTCEGFDVPLKALGSGNYSINIQLSSENKNGTIVSEVSL